MSKAKLIAQPKQYRNTVQSLDSVTKRLKAQYDTVGAWRGVSAQFYNNEIPAGTLCSIAKGREPKNAKHRKILGLPVLITVPACMKCGKVHLTRHYTRKIKYWRDLSKEDLKYALLHRENFDSTRNGRSA